MASPALTPAKRLKFKSARPDHSLQIRREKQLGIRVNSCSALPSMKALAIITALVVGSICIAGQQPGLEHRLAEILQLKLDHIRQNGRLTHPDPTPTIMTEEEVNDYFAAGRVKLPQAVRKVRFEAQSGILVGVATVDFDEIREGQKSSNPLLALFNGMHTVRVESDATAAGGQAVVHVHTVTIDGTTVPRIALDFFLTRYITPKYPHVGIDSSFQLTDRIDMAVIGYHKLTVTQK